MPNSNNIFTGAIAVLKDKNGRDIGLMQDITWSDQFSRQPVYEIGNIYRVEAPLVMHMGSGSFSVASINLFKVDPDSIISGLGAELINRNVTSEQMQTNLTMETEGTQLYIYKKIQDVYDPVTHNWSFTTVPYARLDGILIESSSWRISQGAVVMEDQSFSYGKPITQ